MSRDPLAHPEELVRRVYAYVAYRVHARDEADDVTSEVFESALRYRASYDPSRGEPIAWLIGIARRRLSAGSRGPFELAELTDAPAPGDLEVETALRLDLAAVVGQLPTRDRELVALRYGADLTARQIGKVLELETNAVEVALHRALSRLRVLLEDAEAVRDPSPPPLSIVDTVRPEQGETA